MNLTLMLKLAIFEILGGKGILHCAETAVVQLYGIDMTARYGATKVPSKCYGCINSPERVDRVIYPYDDILPHGLILPESSKKQ